MENILKVRQTLMNSIFEVFERMFYVFLEPAESRPNGEHSYRAAISFSGPLMGELRAFFSRPLAEAMLRNMLNVGGNEINERLMSDCLKEAVNMICGNFLGKHDSGQVFDLSIPTYDSGLQVDDIKAATDFGALRLDFSGGEGSLIMVMMTFSGRDLSVG